MGCEEGRILVSELKHEACVELNVNSNRSLELLEFFFDEMVFKIIPVSFGCVSVRAVRIGCGFYRVADRTQDVVQLLFVFVVGILLFFRLAS